MIFNRIKLSGDNMTNEDKIKDIETGEDIWFKLKYLEKLIKSRGAQNSFLKKAYKLSWDFVIIACFMCAGALATNIAHGNLLSVIKPFACLIIGSFFLIKISVDADWHRSFEEYLKLGKEKKR